MNTYRYLSYMRSRWRYIVAPCLIAAVLALVVSLLQSKEYNAICRILIEPPAGTDSRGALRLTPMYVESLKTYEQFAASDSLFQRALDKFKLRERFPHRTFESLKNRIFKAGMVRETKILEISITLPDARTAHDMAVYLGEETIKLSRTVDQEGAAPVGERLQMIDPGIIPERPTSPNIPMRVMAAFLLGLVVPVIYLTIELSYRTQRANAIYAGHD